MAKQQAKSYQAMVQELAAYMEWFESDQVNLDEAIAKYSQVMELLQEMEKYLKDAENKISKISAKFE